VTASSSRQAALRGLRLQEQHPLALLLILLVAVTCCVLSERKCCERASLLQLPLQLLCCILQEHVHGVGRQECDVEQQRRNLITSVTSMELEQMNILAS
jgi:hypothetical protein